MDNPNIKEFLMYMERDQTITLTKHQKELAESLINYRVKHFSSGIGSGRTTVVNAVQGYFDNNYPENSKAGKEI